MSAEIISVTTVRNVPSDCQFVSDSQDVQPINEVFGTDYDSFFVTVEDGDYGQVYGMCGIVPYLSKLVSRLR